MGLNKHGKPRFRPGRPIAKGVETSAPAQVWQRTMTVIIEGEVHVSFKGDRRYHRQWFSDEGLIAASDESTYEQVVRGFVDERGLFLYRGRDFSPVVIGSLGSAILARLREKLGLADTTEVWFGAVPTSDDRLDGRTFAGTLAELDEWVREDDPVPGA